MRDFLSVDMKIDNILDRIQNKLSSDIKEESFSFQQLVLYNVLMDFKYYIYSKENVTMMSWFKVGTDINI